MIFNSKLLIQGFFIVLLTQILSAQWQATTNLNAERTGHTATRLNNGKVLVTGGFNDTGAFKSCEIFNPETEQWMNTDSMFYTRTGHSAVLLQNGKVLIAGGSDQPGGNHLVSCEIYDPEISEWSLTDSLPVPLPGIQAIQLNSGKVLALGNTDSLDCQIYDPVTGKWSSAESPLMQRSANTTSLLTNGKVLAVGVLLQGREGMYFGTSCELFDPSAGEWSLAKDMPTGRGYHTSTILTNGNLLILGGEYVSSFELYPVRDYYNQCEIYDPVQDIWSQTDSLNQSRKFNTATLLNDSSVLVAGGHFGSDPYSDYHALKSCELYKNGKFYIADSLNIARFGHRATLLQDGKVLITGGISGTHAENKYLKSCEIYTPTITGIFSGNTNLPDHIELLDNYPNPFNPATKISYKLNKAVNVKLEVFNVQGRRVAILADKFEQPGIKSVEFNADGLSSGVYFFRLKAGNYIQTKKMMLLR